MKEYRILFPNDSHEEVEQKIEIVKKLIGENNISYMDDLDRLHTPCIMIRCKKKQWKEIKFRIDLVKAYW